METESISQRVAQAYRDCETRSSLPKLLSSLPTATFKKLTCSLASPPVGVSSEHYLRALWLCKERRLLLMAECLRAAGNGVRTLLPELELMLVEAALDASVPPSQRAKAVSQCATTLVLHAHYASQEMLARFLLACARAAANVRSQRADLVTQRILMHVLNELTSAQGEVLAAVLLAVMESEFATDKRILPQLIVKLEDVASRDCSTILSPQIPALFNAATSLLVNADSHPARSSLARIACRIAAGSLHSTHAEILLALEIAVADNECVAQYILELYETCTDCIGPPLDHGRSNPDQSADNDHAAAGPLQRITWRISAMDCAFLYVFLSCTNSDIIRKRCLRVLQVIASDDNVRFDTSKAASSSAAARHSPQELHRSIVLRGSVTMPGIEIRSALIADVGNTLVWSSCRRSQLWGSQLLLETFIRHSRARRKVLDYIFAAVTDGATPTRTRRRFCEVLSRLAHHVQAALFFRDYIHTIDYWLGFIGSMPLDSGCSVVRALSAISGTLCALCDRLVVHLRKLADSRSRISRHVSLHGFVALAFCRTLSDTTFAEVSRIVESFLANLRADTCVAALTVLIRMLRDADQEQKKRLNRINDNVLAQLRPLLADGSESTESHPASSAIRLSCCFAECCQGLPINPVMPLYLLYVVELRASNACAAAIFRDTLSYVCDPRRALLEACDPKGVPEGVHQKWVYSRLSLLMTLCEVFLRVEDLPSTSLVLQVYALASIVRDAIPPSLHLTHAHDKECPLASVALREGNPQCALFAREHSAHSNAAGPRKDPHEEQCPDSTKSLHIESLGLRRTLTLLRQVQSGVHNLGNYASAVLRAELLWHALQVREHPGMNNNTHGSDSRDVLRDGALVAGAEVRATNPSDEHTTLTFVDSKAAVRQITPNAPLQGNDPEGADDTKANTRETDHTMPMSPNSEVERSTSVQEPAEEDEESPIVDVCRAFRAVRFRPAADAIHRASSSENIPENARLSARTSALRLLLCSASTPLQVSEWSFLQSNSTTHCSEKHPSLRTQVSRHSHSSYPDSKTVEECRSDGFAAVTRNVVKLFEQDFTRSLNVPLALAYVDVLTKLLAEDVRRGDQRRHGVRQFLSQTVVRILAQYRIAQTRVARALLSLLLSAMDEVAALHVIRELFLWLGAEEGVLHEHYKADGPKYVTGDFDNDILIEAYEMDGVEVPQTISKLSMEGKPTECAGTEEPEDLNGQEGDTGGKAIHGTSIKELGLNDSEEMCLSSVLCALQRLDDVIPSHDRLRRFARIANREKSDCCTILLAISDAMSALLCTQTRTHRNRSVITWSRNLSRKVLLTLTRLLSAVLTLLVSLRQRMLGADSGLHQCSEGFSVVLRVAQMAIGDTPSGKSAKALSALDSNERLSLFCQRLELELAAIVYDLDASEPSLPVVDELRHVLESIAKHSRRTRRCELDPSGSTALDLPPAEQSIKRPSKRRRLRSRNKVIDTWLVEESGEDNYADLEDFVVDLSDNEL